ncbi:MAG: DHHW family protein [Candidatus Avoscillospira sp.]
MYKETRPWIMKLTLLAAAAFLLAVSLLTFRSLLQTTEGYAFYENRYLDTVETLSAESLLDGSFTGSLEPAFSDHFVMRERWIKLYNRLQLSVLEKTSLQNLVLTEDLLLPVQTPQTAQSYEADAQAMAAQLKTLSNAVEAYGGTFLFVGLPEQSTILQDRYPAPYFRNEENHKAREAAMFRAGAALDVPMLDMTPLFEASADSSRLYYRTDHHYRLEGAYLTYRTICETLQAAGLDLSVLTEDDFDYVTLPNPFLGSRNKKLMGLYETEETLEIYQLHAPIQFTRRDNGETVETTVFDLPASENAYVEYHVYMGGDKAETVIETNRPWLPDCLIFGDSFTNALETFLYTSFDETRSLDLRYNDASILDYVQTWQPDVVLLVQNDTTYLLQTGNGQIE